LRERVALREIQAHERAFLAAQLRTRELSPPCVVVFGELPILSEDPLLLALRDLGQSARVFLGTGFDLLMLEQAVNFCGVDRYITEAEAPEGLARAVEDLAARIRGQRNEVSPFAKRAKGFSGVEMQAHIQTVLLVDDEPDIRKIGQISLVEIGKWEVLLAASGDEALDIARQHRPDLILLDVMMPHLDGLSTLQQLRTQDETKEIPVIFMTAKAQRQEVSRYLRTGAIGVITKPFDPLTLPQQIQACLAEKR
jgi:CheY-like chemotaxis protein